MSLAGQRPDPARYQIIPRTLIFGIREGRVLLQKVPESRGAWAGLWNGIGGHVAQGESPERSARREFAEETGLTIDHLRMAGLLLVDVGSSPGIGVFVFVGDVEPGDPQPNHEGELGWYAPQETQQIPTVADLPILLPRALAVHAGQPPFSGVTRFRPDGTGDVRLD